DAVAPAGDVVPGRRVAVGAVDVEQLDRSGDEIERRLGRGAHMTYPRGDLGALQVGLERAVVGLALVGRAADLLGAAIVPGVRIDRDDLDAVGRRAGQHDRRAPAVGAEASSAGSTATTAASRNRNLYWNSASMYCAPRLTSASRLMARPSSSSALEACSNSGPRATRSSSPGTVRNSSSTGTATALTSAVARARTGRGSRPSAARRAASGSR